MCGTISVWTLRSQHLPSRPGSHQQAGGSAPGRAGRRLAPLQHLVLGERAAGEVDDRVHRARVRHEVHGERRGVDDARAAPARSAATRAGAATGRCRAGSRCGCTGCRPARRCSPRPGSTGRPAGSPGRRRCGRRRRPCRCGTAARPRRPRAGSAGCPGRPGRPTGRRRSPPSRRSAPRRRRRSAGWGTCGGRARRSRCRSAGRRATGAGRRAPCGVEASNGASSKSQAGST